MKTLLRSLSIALAIGTTHAAVIFDIGDVVRPGGSGTANTVIFGTGLTSPNFPASMNVTGAPPTSVEFSAKNGFFITYFDSQTLAVGETLQLDYALTFQGADIADNGFRSGLFNSATGTVFTSDQTTTTNSGLSNYQGYFEAQRVTLTSTGNAFQRSSTTSQTSLFSFTNGQNLGSPAGLGATNGTPYTAMISITRTGATTLRLDSQFGSQTLQSFVDSDNIVTTFNAFAFQIGNTSNPATPTTLTFTQMTVSVVPEPGVLTLLLPSLALGFVLLGRRQRARFSES